MKAVVFTEKSLAAMADNDVPLTSFDDAGMLRSAGLIPIVRDDIAYVLSPSDTGGSRRLLVYLGGQWDALSGLLTPASKHVIRRLLAFFERTKTAPISLPHGWGQYKSDNLIAFFACPRDRLADEPRWIAEVSPRGNPNDVCLWRLTSSSDKVLLEDFSVPEDIYVRAIDKWSEIVEAMSDIPADSPAVETLDELNLAEADFSDVTQDLTFNGWLEKLTPQQRAFVEQAPDHSIRLRGPGGSGKTLTLELKAIREVLGSRRDDVALRVLFVTHSWVLAGEVDANIERLSEWGRLDEITVLPLLAVAQELLPTERWDRDLQLVGEDSLSGKALQLSQIERIIADFLSGDWLTFRDEVSPAMRDRLESADPSETRAFAWDCLIEFGCVLGADGIFPGVNAESRYLRLARTPWMMPLPTDADKRLVLYLYETYIRDLVSQGRLTTDQLVNDFLNYLETFIWNVRRERMGYDLIFVDEFHLFNVQERQLLRYLTKSASHYPRIFMALDPRQSPWEVYAGLGDAAPASALSSAEDDFGTVSSVDLQTVHRFSPEILALVKHVNWEFPNLDLGADWEIDFSTVSSTADSGATPQLVQSGTQAAEIVDIYRSLKALRAGAGARWQIAIAIVDHDKFDKYAAGVQTAAQGLKVSVTVVTGREDVEILQYRRRGIVIGPAEYLAGLQFDAVLIAGMPDLQMGQANAGYRRRRYLSLLYLAITRAARDVKIFVNDDHGGIPEVLDKAHTKGLVDIHRGGLV